MKKLFQWLAALFLAAALALTASGCGGKKQEALPAGSALTVRILDIGQGDAMLLSKDGEWALIDSGDVDHRPDMKRYLKEYGVKKLSKVIITHPHADHVGGMYAVFQAAEIGERDLGQRRTGGDEYVPHLSEADQGAEHPFP